LANAERVVAAIRALGREAHFFNANAADPERRAEVVAEMERVLADRGDAGALRVLLHSLAFGTLTPYIDDPIKNAVTQAQMDMTLDVMAHSLVYWTQEVVRHHIQRHDAGCDGAQPRVLDPGGRGPRAHDARRPHLRDDVVGEHARPARLRAGVR